MIFAYQTLLFSLGNTFNIPNIKFVLGFLKHCQILCKNCRKPRKKSCVGTFIVFPSHLSFLSINKGPQGENLFKKGPLKKRIDKTIWLILDLSSIRQFLAS